MGVRPRRSHSPATALAIYRRVVSGAAKIQVRQAIGTDGFDATRSIRHAVYCLEKGFLDQGALLDAWDQRGLVLNAWQDGRAIGTLRITDSDHGPLEIFDMHPELRQLIPRRARVLELSRLMVLKRHRDVSVTVAMYRRAIAELITRGANGLILSCAARLIPYYRDALGCQQLSDQPLRHARLQGLIDYPMFLDWPGVLERATPQTLPFWFAIDPAWCLRAVRQTSLRMAREELARLTSSTGVRAT